MAKLSFTEPKEQEEVKPGEVHTVATSVVIEEADPSQVKETVAKWERSGFTVDVKLTIKEPK